MYRPKAFSEDRLEVLHQFIRENPLASLVTAGPKGMLANLIPIMLSQTGSKGTLRCHLARANPQLERLKAGDEVLLIFQGPHGYVSPNFYPSKKIHGKVVPTWNYSVVQVRGQVTVIDDPQWLLEHISELTDNQEAGNESPWKVSDAPKDYILSQLKAIAGVEITVQNIEGKFKASQNQSDENQEGVAQGFSKIGNLEMASLVATRKLQKTEPLQN